MKDQIIRYYNFFKRRVNNATCKQFSLGGLELRAYQQNMFRRQGVTALAKGANRGPQRGVKRGGPRVPLGDDLGLVPPEVGQGLGWTWGRVSNG